MFDDRAGAGGAGASVFEALLSARLPAGVTLRRPPVEVLVTGAVHGQGSWSNPAALPTPPDLELGPEARLLEEGAGWLDTAAEMERGLAQLAGARARALASFARCRPAAWDRQPGERGAASAASRAARPAALTEVSEWAVAEVSARLRLPGRTASALLAECVDLVQWLPATLAALEAGEISWLQARALVELLRPVSEDKRPLVEARVLPRAPRQTVAQLRECTKRAIARIDADAVVERLARAIRDRKVTLIPGNDGMAVLEAHLPTPVARAVHEVLRAFAGACAVGEDGQPDPRCLDQRMADCFADVFLRPDAEGRSRVQVLLTVVAGVGTVTGVGPDADEPGEIDGDTVPAALVRELAHALGLMPRPVTEVGPDTTTATAPSADAAAMPAGAACRPQAELAEGAEGVDRPQAESIDPADPADPADRPQAQPAEPAESVEGAVPTQASGPHPADGSVPAAVKLPDPQLVDASDVTVGSDPAAANPTDPQLTDASDLTDLSDPAAVAQRQALGALLDVRRLADSALAERPRIAVVEQLTGCLLALTDSIELRAAVRSGEGLGPPEATDGYRPSAPLDRFVRMRDRRCRFPGCRARIRKCDLDHRVPYPHGPTAHTNLAGLCEHHHRLSHQAPGWRLGGNSDGGLVWTLPGGATITTVPPGFGTDDGSQPTAAGEAGTSSADGVDWRRLSPAERRARLRDLIQGRPAHPDEEPAAF